MILRLSAYSSNYIVWIDDSDLKLFRPFRTHWRLRKGGKDRLDYEYCFDENCKVLPGQIVPKNGPEEHDRRANRRSSSVRTLVEPATDPPSSMLAAGHTMYLYIHKYCWRSSGPVMPSILGHAHSPGVSTVYCVRLWAFHDRTAISKFCLGSDWSQLQLYCSLDRTTSPARSILAIPITFWTSHFGRFYTRLACHSACCAQKLYRGYIYSLLPRQTSQKRSSRSTGEIRRAPSMNLGCKESGTK